MATEVVKWVAAIRDDDIFITQATFKQTAKQLSLMSTGYNETAIGLGGKVERLITVLKWHVVFSRSGDSPLYDTYEEAVASIQQQLDKRATSAVEKLKRISSLQHLLARKTPIK